MKGSRESRVLPVLIALVVEILLASCAATSNRGFMVVAPRRFLAASEETVCVTLHPRQGDETSSSSVPSLVTLSLMQPGSNKSITSASLHVYSKEGGVHTGACLQLNIPETQFTRADLQVVVRSGEYVENRTNEVTIQQNSVITFIETDRPFYKPGELVKIRLISLKHDLTPDFNMVSKVWVESPSDIRMAQWLDVPTELGLVQLELQLSEEPVQGLWEIKVQKSNGSDVTKKTFEVKEYVLPKFEVQITPPEYITEKSLDLTWNICAKYSYGKPVEGNVSINATFELPYMMWYSDSSPDISRSVSKTAELSKAEGCYKFHLGREDITKRKGRFANHILIKASVEEAGTGEIQEGTERSNIHMDRLTIDFSLSPEYFKPRLPYFGRIQVQRRNSEVTEGKVVRLCLKLQSTKKNQLFRRWNLESLECLDYTSDSKGYVDFVIPPQTKDIATIILEASIKNAEDFDSQSYASLDVKQWFSPTESFIQVVDTSAGAIKCNSRHPLDIYYVAPNISTNITFFYIVQSRGDIVHLGHKEIVNQMRQMQREFLAQSGLLGRGTIDHSEDAPKIGRWSLKLNISPRLGPTSQLLVYFVKDDGEIVAGSHKLKIHHCFDNKVKATFSRTQVEPGQKVNLHLSADPSSLCALTGMDKAVTFLGKRDNSLDQHQVFQELKKFHINSATPSISDMFLPCLPAGETHPIFNGGREPMPVPMPLRSQRHKRFIASMNPSYANSMQAFYDAGVVVLSDLESNVSPCSGHNLSKPLCNPCPVFNLMLPMVAVARSGVGIGSNTLRGAKSRKANTNGVEMALYHSSAAVVPKMLINTYESSNVETPVVEMRTLFPETWLWDLVPIGETGEEKVELETPHSITDWVVNTHCMSADSGLGVAPHTSLNVFKPFFMDFTIPYSIKRGEILSLKVSLFNYLNHGLPIRLTFKEFTGGDLLSEHEYISKCLGERSSIVHEFKLTPKELGEHNISVIAKIDSDFSEPCGPEFFLAVSDGVTKSIIIKPEGFPVEINNSTFVCLSEDEDSVSVSWDLFLPEDLVDDSARTFVSVIGDLMGPSLENLDGLVQLPMGCGEQNMILFVPNILVLDYLNSTNQINPALKTKSLGNMRKGYQRELTYRHKDGSYSAFGESDPEGSMWLTAFVVKSYAQASRHIFIDKDDLRISVDWIIKKQLENGCFPFHGKIFHKDMKGGLGADNSPTALSAYVLISLLETGLELPPSLKTDGMFCLQGEQNLDLYSLVLTTYALTLMGEKEKAEEYFENLLEVATIDGDYLYWEKQGSNNLGLSVEMTAYAIMSLVNLDGEENLIRALKAIRWISKHRNSNGGFISTQDTVVALEALSRYAIAVPGKDVHMEVEASTEEWNNQFSLRPENRLVLQQKYLPSVPSILHFHAKGKGCALVQSTMRYSVKTAPFSEAFDLKMRVSSVPNINKNTCANLQIKACMRYTLPDGASNMAVLEIDLLSGYIPVKSSIDLLITNPIIKLKRWDDSKGQINFYFDSLTNATVCLNFLIEQEVEVENPQNANARVYDYYEQEYSVSKSYGLDGIFCESEMLPHPEPVDKDIVVVNFPIPKGRVNLTTPEDMKSLDASLVSSTIGALPWRVDQTVADQASEMKNVQTDPFSQFVNVDHELDFPDGEEGSQPVFVQAPQQSQQFQSLSEASSFGNKPILCPTCHDEAPTGMSQMYCSASMVIKMATRSSRSAKLLLDVSPGKRPHKIQKNVSLLMDKTCQCEALSKGGGQVLLVIANRSSNPLTLTEKPTLHLDQGVRIIRISPTPGMPNVIKQARKRC